MLIAKNDEAKRSRIWSRGMIISSLIIVFVAAYLMIKVMNENPVAGEWIDDDGNYAVNILNNGTLEVTDFEEEDDNKMEFLYKIDKESRMLAVSSDEDDLENVLLQNASEDVEDAAGVTTQTVIFSYSVENDRLVLTEREYGEQLVLIKE